MKGSTKVPARVHQGPTKVLQVSWCLWFCGAGPFWAAKRFRPKRFCGRFTKVPARFHQGSTKVSPRLRKFRDLSGLLGQIGFGVPKGSVEGTPITSLKLFRSSTLFFCIFPALALGSSAIVKAFGQNGTFVFLGSLQQKGSLECSPNSSLHWSHSLLWFLGKWLLLQKGSVEGSANYSLHLSPKWLLLHKSCLEGSANCALHLSPSLLVGSKLRELLTCLTHTKSSPQKTTHHVVAVGVFFGLFF